MPVSRKRGKVKGLSINNRNYPLIVTSHFGSFSKTTRRIQKTKYKDGSLKVIEHYVLLN